MLLTSSSVWAQSPKKRAKEAEALAAQGAFSQAAEYYKSAYQADTKKAEWAYASAENFLRVRDYENAAAMYAIIKDQNKLFDKPGFKYAQCLKQMGKYDDAKKEFESFGLTYNGTDYQKFESVVKNEMAGCDFAKELDKSTTSGADTYVEHLDSRINTDKTEFAPIPFQLDDKEVLYFSSNADGTAKIFRSEKGAEGWSARATPAIFNKVEKDHFGNGSFTPDGNRFYFTQCDLAATGATRCDIYVMEKDNGSFGLPIKLPDFVNSTKANSTHPFVTVVDGREYLFFASDREGSRGGMDIWFVTKSAESSGVNFTLPVNVGPTINTAGDEITPFYDPAEQVLYFSSTGHPGLGGLDVFSSKGSQTRWEKPKNMGKPLNSSADDLYYIAREFNNGAYFVSNRLFPPDRTSTSNDDIFFLGQKEIVANLNGKVLNKSGEVIPDSKVALYEVAANDSKKLLKEKVFENGNFAFKLEPKKKYLVQACRPNYKCTEVMLSTEDLTASEDFVEDITLEKISPTELIVPKAEASAERPYKVPSSVPIDPSTGKPYADYTEEFKEWNRIFTIAQKSKTGTVYYTGDGELVVADPIVDERPAVVETPTPKGKDKGKGKGKDKGKDKTILKPNENNSTTSTPTENPTTDNTTTSTPTENPDNTTTEEPVRNSGGSNVAVRPASPDDDKVEEGTTYRIQIAAVNNYKEKTYKKASKVGEIFTDEKAPNGMTRVVVGTFNSVTEAREALVKLNKAGFDDAFINRYEGDERKGDGFR